MRIEVPQIDPTLWLCFSLEAKHRGTEVSELLSDALRLYLGLGHPTTSPKPRNRISKG